MRVTVTVAKFASKTECVPEFLRNPRDREKVAAVAKPAMCN